jgi:uncharacterized protein YndB with AHSA1/START domain
MAEIRHEFSFHVSRERLFQALTEQEHVSRWWTSESEIKPAIGSLARFTWKTHGWVVVMKVMKLEPGKTVEWKCVSSNMQDTTAWVDTVVRFDLIESGEEQSILRFSQSGYGPSVCYDVCHEGWAFVLGRSLKSYLELGAGHPYRAEVQAHA